MDENVVSIFIFISGRVDHFAIPQSPHLIQRIRWKETSKCLKGILNVFLISLVL